jgi:hypothetical protein
MLVQSLSGAFAGVPRGFAVVAASDVLLTFGFDSSPPAGAEASSSSTKTP